MLHAILARTYLIMSYFGKIVVWKSFAIFKYINFDFGIVQQIG